MGSDADSKSRIMFFTFQKSKFVINENNITQN
eukprot:UN04751